MSGTRHGAVYGCRPNSNGWTGAAEDMAATYGIKPNAPGWFPEQGRQLIADNRVQTRSGMLRHHPGAIQPGGNNPSFPWLFTGAWLHMLFGVLGTDTVSTVGTNGKLHAGTLHDTLAAKVLCGVARYPGLGIVEVPAYKIDQAVLTWSGPTDFPTWQFTPYMRDVLYEGDGSINNTDTEVDTLTYDETGGFASPLGPVFRLAAQSTTTPLDSGDELGINNLQLTISRRLSDADPTNNDDGRRSEPYAGDWEWVLRVQLESYADFTNWTRARAGSDLMLDCIWTGGALPNEPTENYYGGIYMPQAQIRPLQTQGNPKLRQTLELVGDIAAASVSGFTDLGPYILNQNEATAAYIT